MNVDSLGAGVIMRIYRFVNNVKNFRSLSMGGKIRTIATPIVPLAVMGTGALTTGFQSAQVTDVLQVGPLQQVMMQSCIDNHTEQMVDFGHVMSTPYGCACTAKLVSSMTPPAHYKAYGALHKFNLDQWNWTYDSEDEAEQVAQYEKRLTAGLANISKTAGVNIKGLRHMNDYINSAETVCDMKESYEAESGASLAALRPLETPIWEGDSEGVVQISLRGLDQPLRVSMRD